jgi:hypothetical protein
MCDPTVAACDGIRTVTENQALLIVFIMEAIPFLFCIWLNKKFSDIVIIPFIKTRLIVPALNAFHWAQEQPWGWQLKWPTKQVHDLYPSDLAEDVAWIQKASDAASLKRHLHSDLLDSN